MVSNVASTWAVGVSTSSVSEMTSIEAIGSLIGVAYSIGTGATTLEALGFWVEPRLCLLEVLLSVIAL